MGSLPVVLSGRTEELWMEVHNEVGPKIKIKRETKDLETETRPGEGVMKEKFLRKRKRSHRKGQWGALESKRAA